MMFRTAYEFLLLGLGILIAWKLIVKPGYALATGRTLRVGKNTTTGDKLAEAQEELQDEQVLTEAEKALGKAAALRQRRTQKANTTNKE